MFQVVEIPDERKPGGFKLISLFESINVDPEENNLWTITLTCTAPAKEYIFNIENLGYLRYRLKNVAELKSRYSYVLFMYLENNRYRKTWKIELDDLKDVLCCTAARYEQYKFFNSEVLQKCYKELNEKTECHFEYEPVKQGRFVIAICFTMASNSRVYVEEDTAVNQVTETSALWKEALRVFDFTEEQCDELQSVLVTIPAWKMPFGESNEAIEIKRYHYIDQIVKTMQRRDTSYTIKNKFLYLLKVLKKDASLSEN